MIDANRGIWLNADRDDDNNVAYTIVIDGEPFDISSKAYDELQAVYFDLIKQGEQNAKESFTKLLEAEQARTKLGFIQYATIEKLLGNKTEGS